MSLSVQTNIAAMDAHRNLVGTTGALQQSMERLSSGYRINRAADDAAGAAPARTCTRRCTSAMRVRSLAPPTPQQPR